MQRTGLETECLSTFSLIFMSLIVVNGFMVEVTQYLPEAIGRSI